MVGEANNKRPAADSKADLNVGQGLFTLFVLIPVSILFDIYSYVHEIISGFFEDPTYDHHKRVKDVQDQIRRWQKTDQSVPMCTARPARLSVSPQKLTYKSRLYNIKIDMPNILELDEKNLTVLVEPMVDMKKINKYLLDRGYTLPVVPELDELTMGGLVMGGGLETTSKRYGMFHRICLGYEIVLSDASVIWCDKDNHSELFEVMPFSYGTFGFLTAVKLQIMPLKRYVKLTYHPTRTVPETVSLMTKASFDDNVDIVEGIVYNEDEAVIMTGSFVDDDADFNPGQVNDLGLWYKPWFYTHVESFLTSKDPSREESFTEYIPTLSYFRRHVKSVFWLMRGHIGCANHPAFRYPLGWTMPFQLRLVKFLQMEVLKKDMLEDDFVLQDFGFRVEDVGAVLEKLHQKCQVYPIWLCPFVNLEDVNVHDGSVLKAGTMLTDVGIYGKSPKPGFSADKFQREMEQYCFEMKGGVGFYAKTLLTREEFDKMCYHVSSRYDRIRKEYKCEKAFPHVYYKISCEGRD